MLTPTSFLSMQEDFHQEDGHSSDLDQKRSGTLLMVADHKENGDSVAELMMKNSSVSRMQSFTYSQFRCCVLERMNQNPISNTAC